MKSNALLVTFDGTGSGQEEQDTDASAEGDPYNETLYPVGYGDDIISIYCDENDILHVWYGNASTDEEYYSYAYDSYAYENDVLYGYSEYGADEFEYMPDGYVDVLLTGCGATDYLTCMTEELYFSGGGSDSGTMYIADGDELKNFARDNSNIGITVTFTAEVGGNFSTQGEYLLYCYCGDGSFVQISASAVSGLTLFDGDKVSYTGVFNGFTGGGNQLQFNTVSVELQ